VVIEASNSVADPRLDTGVDAITNAELLERRERAVPRGVGTAFPVFAARAQNAEIWDVEGRRYIDFAAGIAVLAVGHRHPAVIAAVEGQMARFTHTAFQVTAYEPYIELAERLNAIAPFSGEAKTIFFTTGAEAVENAIKVARYATGRQAIISFTGSFHGRTILASALTGKVTPYKRGMGSVPSVFHVPFPNPIAGTTVEASLKALDYLFSADIAPEDVAAIILEPVQGEGGFHVAPPEFLRSLRELCDRFGILLVADEVQTAFGRTGRMFAIEHSGVEPDLVTIAKAVGGGFPLSGLIGRSELLDTVPPGGLGGTYAGSPIACAAGLAVLDVIAAEGLVDRARGIGERITTRVEAMQRRNDLLPIGHIRGQGAMIAFDLLAGKGTDQTDPDAAKRVSARALDEGLIVLNCGSTGEAIRFLPPLTISDAHLDEGLACLEAALVNEAAV
jgi:4-aminobutyrate aminotransferase/(S)-3-amino-2-methylpropionate transaminase